MATPAIDQKIADLERKYWQSIGQRRRDRRQPRRRNGQWFCAVHTESVSGDPFRRDRHSEKWRGTVRPDRNALFSFRV